MGRVAANTKRRPISSRTRPVKQRAPKRASRTTVAFSPSAIEIVERFREATGLSMSEAVSELIERTEPRPARIKIVDGMPMADIPMDGEWVTTSDILRAQAEIG